MPLIEKEVIRPGTYWYKDETTGQPRKLVVTPELTKYWHEQGNAMLSAGLTVPVPFEHDFQAHPMTPADKLKNNSGWVKEYRLKGDRLFSAVDIQDAEVAKKLPGTIRWTSPWINSFTDGQGKEWKNVISHLALTTRPRIIEQEPFGSVAAALSVAEPIKGWNEVGTKGCCLSNAGLINGDKPVYPMAFSLYSGAAFTTDATGHEHDEGGKFASGAHAASKKTEGSQKSKHHAASSAALKHSKRAAKTGKAQHHVEAEKAHREAIGHHEKEAAHWRVSSAQNANHLYAAHTEAIKHHKAAAEHHRVKGGGGHAAFAVDAPPKGKKPPTGSGADDVSVVDDDLGGDDDFDDGDDIPDDGDPTNDDNVDLEPFGDPAGDVSMTELLCDLLGALGVVCEHSDDESQFKRNLYNAAMTKIHELVGKAQNGPPQDPKNRANPPGQPPNNPRPGQPGQPNPLIQQEQQPMYMSLEDINKISDPTMKNIALSMYNENVKLRAELDAGNKTANSLRDAKLKEENAKRQQRVMLLSRLSPKVKADLDAMLALPAMALSMGEGGEVVDPMAQTLAILEKGLGDMPRLLTTDATALSVQPQPKDADMLSQERIDELADTLARQMGAPPEKKAG